MERTSIYKSSFLLPIVGAILLSGCSDQTAKVSGTVFLDGEPIEITASQRGTVTFRPVEGGATCSGLIGKEGKYSIATGRSTSLVPGDYLVSVQVVQSVPPKGGLDAPSGTPVTPAVYADPLTSDLNFVVEDGANQIDIKLDSSAGPAKAPRPESEEPEPETEQEDEVAEEATEQEEATLSGPDEDVAEENATGEGDTEDDVSEDDAESAEPPTTEDAETAEPEASEAEADADSPTEAGVEEVSATGGEERES